jgi:hypothetical protein
MSFLTKMQFMFENLFIRVTRLIPSASGKILYNKWVLYFIFVIGIYDVIHFYQRGNIMAVAIFFIVGFLTAFFSKNMIVVIVSAIAVSHIVAYGNKMTEGLNEEKEEEEEEGFAEGADGKEEEEEEEGFAEGADGAEEEEEKKTSEEEEKITSNIEKMQNLLNQTEKIIKDSTQEPFSSFQFTAYN